ncbi:MAG: winged helix-turn-helix transcriptional regulator [Candidatus Marinimicrobia bacterium]|nr:winged helix-turn-helix transcriptional regulator [Candidatus Neomarinimicrobiota bacterium]
MLRNKETNKKGHTVDKTLYEMHAGICAALANAKRIQIIDLLQDGEKMAGILAREMGINKANLSQHLQLMKSKGIVLSRRDGVSTYYSIANSKIITACRLMREVMMEQLENISKLQQEYVERH